MQVELLFLNGESLVVDLAAGLEEAKVKAAQVLETAPQAVSINAGRRGSGAHPTPAVTTGQESVSGELQQLLCRGGPG